MGLSLQRPEDSRWSGHVAVWEPVPLGEPQRMQRPSGQSTPRKQEGSGVTGAERRVGPAVKQREGGALERHLALFRAKEGLVDRERLVHSSI